MMSYNNSDVVQYLRQYEMFANSLKLIRTIEEKNMVIKQLAKLEGKILTLTNDLYEEEYYELVNKECALLDDEKKRIVMLIDLIDQRLSYVEKRCNDHYQLTGESIDAPVVLGADTLDELENKIRIIDKYSKNIRLKAELGEDIKSLKNKISLASEKIGINESLNIELENAFKERMKNVFDKLSLYDLLEQKEDIEYTYREIEDSLNLAKGNLEVAKNGHFEFVTECEKIYDEVNIEYTDYKDKVSTIELMEIFNANVNTYDELLNKRKKINDILKYIKNNRLVGMIMDLVTKQYNTILMEQQDINTFNDLVVEKEKKVGLLNQIEEENNSEEFQSVLRVLIENERKKQEKILEEQRRQEEVARRERMELERRRQEEFLKRQKIIEEARKKEMEKRTKQMLEEQQNSVLQPKKHSDNVSFATIKDDISEMKEIKKDKIINEIVDEGRKVDFADLEKKSSVNEDIIFKNKQDIEKELFAEFENNKVKESNNEILIDKKNDINNSKLPDISIDEYMKSFDENKIDNTNSLFEEDDFPSIPM